MVTVPIKGNRAYARQEARYLDLARVVRYFRDERGMTREQVMGMINSHIDIIDTWRIFTDGDGNPLPTDVSDQARNVLNQSRADPEPEIDFPIVSPRVQRLYLVAYHLSDWVRGGCAMNDPSLSLAVEVTRQLEPGDLSPLP